MLPADVLDLRGVAARLGVGYHWLQANWRSLDGFPPPFLGGGKGQRPRWALRAIMEFRDGRRWAASEAAPVALSAALPVANDPHPAPISDPVAALLAAAGG